MKKIIEKIDTIFELKKELDGLGMIEFSSERKRGDSVHVFGVNDFVALASDNPIEIVDFNDEEYPFEATFECSGYTFFAILSEGEKEELEKLINEREVNEFIDSLEDL